MAHNDLQTQLPHTWKRTNDEHPIDRILTEHLTIKTPHTNTRSNTYKSATNHIIQRQRVIRSFLSKPEENEPSIRKPMTLDDISKSLSITSISSPQLLFAQLNESSTNNNNRQATIKKDCDHPSSLLARRQCRTIENASPIHQVSDMNDLSTNQLTIAIPPNFIFRNKPSRVSLSDRPAFKTTEKISSPRITPLNSSKTIHQTPSHTWTPRLHESTLPYTRTLNNIPHAKSQLSQQLRNHQRQSLPEKMNHYSKINYFQDLYISPQGLTNPFEDDDTNKRTHKRRFPSDEWGYSKSNHDTNSDEDDSGSANGNSSTSTCNSQISLPKSDHSSSLSTQHDLFSSAHSFSQHSKSKTTRSSIKRNNSRRRIYNIALPPVVEHLDAEEIDVEQILAKISALQNEKVQFAMDEENSLTFQLLNQQETEFEKHISKSRKVQSKEK